MNKSIPTNPAKFFELAVCTKCKHKACLSLPTEKMTKFGAYRFEFSPENSSSECPFYATDMVAVKSFLETIGIERLNQIYRYILNEFNINGVTPVASVPVEGIEGKGALIITLIAELVKSGKVRVFGVPNDVSDDIQIQWWMRAHHILAKPKVTAS